MARTDKSRRPELLMNIAGCIWEGAEERMVESYVVSPWMTMGNMGFQQRTSVCDTAVSDHRSLGGAAGQGVLRIWKTR